MLLKAVNSVSSYTFTEDELLEVGDNYMLVDAAFWDANHANQEVAKALKQLVPLSLPARYKFYYHMSTGKYPLSDSEPTSFYGPDLEKDGALTEIRNTGEAMLAVDLTDNGAPAYRTKDHHRCYLLKKTYKSFYGVFRVNKGQRAAGLDLKLEKIKQVLKDKETSESMGTNDKFTQTESEIVYEYRSEAEQTPTGVFGYKGLKYDNSRYGNTCRQIEFIFIKQ